MKDNELLSIKEFSKLTGIKDTTLRYYDDLGLFSPAVRGENNYRYYTPQQLITINSIEHLHNLDMTIKQIVELEKDRSPQSIADALGTKESELKAQLEQLQRSFDVIHTLRNLINEGLGIDENKINLLSLDEMPMIIGPDNVFKESDNFYDTFLNFCSEAEQRNIDLRLPVGGLYRDIESFVDHPAEPEQFFSYDPRGKDIRAAGTYLVGYTRGYYGRIFDVQDRLLAYAKKHQLAMVGPVTVVYIHDEICVKDHDQYLAEVQVRVEQRTA